MKITDAHLEWLDGYCRERGLSLDAIAKVTGVTYELSAAQREWLQMRRWDEIERRSEDDE
jgi:hypothetical protein